MTVSPTNPSKPKSPPHEPTVSERLAPLKDRLSASKMKDEAERQIKENKEKLKNLKEKRDEFIPRHPTGTLQDDVDTVHKQDDNLTKDIQALEDIKKQASKKIANTARDTLLAHIIDIQTYNTPIKGEKGVLNFERRSGLYTGIKKNADGSYEHGVSDTNLKQLLILIRNEWEESGDSRYTGSIEKINEALRSENIHGYLENNYKNIQQAPDSNYKNQSKINEVNARLENIKAFLGALGAKVPATPPPTYVDEPEPKPAAPPAQQPTSPAQTPTPTPEPAPEAPSYPPVNRDDLKKALVNLYNTGSPNEPMSTDQGLESNLYTISELDIPNMGVKDLPSLNGLKTNLQGLLSGDLSNELKSQIQNILPQVDALIKELEYEGAKN